MMKKLMLALGIMLCSVSVFAEPVVVGNPSGVDQLNAKEVKKLFLGKLKKLPNGAKPVIVEYSDGTPIKEAFHLKATKKSESQLKAYWAQLVFRGKAKPPKAVDSAAAVIAEVSNNPAAVGYIDSTEVTDSVKVIFTP
ncbi:phosphate ABC transporter substrate-binding protein [Vibrio sp. JC009]|uniref:phosphate ABC transporter substrate-binding protein n=1 Tax=Vibrio sp. JC009 TaxID=2912314 RepID=UPI0023B15C40|nr:phosphate ABC transporter substrate-binding protein [Vibrio sp. JC009]WED22459.1 phosphate ABC transporter substrate-binding protein [Vibrio sp. JC009]